MDHGRSLRLSFCVIRDSCLFRVNHFHLILFYFPQNGKCCCYLLLILNEIRKLRRTKKFCRIFEIDVSVLSFEISFDKFHFLNWIFTCFYLYLFFILIFAICLLSKIFSKINFYCRKRVRYSIWKWNTCFFFNENTFCNCLNYTYQRNFKKNLNYYTSSYLLKNLLLICYHIKRITHTHSYTY